MAGMEESSFLMHRVELKDLATTTRTNVKVNVPNAPCGVERRHFLGWQEWKNHRS